MEDSNKLLPSQDNESSYPASDDQTIDFGNDDSFQAEVEIIPTRMVVKKFNKQQRSRAFIEESIKKGAMNILSSKFESLDYDVCENHLMQTEENKSYNFIVYKSLVRWVIFFLIGVFTALIGVFIDISIDLLSKPKYEQLKKYLDRSVEHSMVIPLAMWIAFNVVPVLAGSLLVTYIEPVALGSGIPQVKCYLNGIKIPRIVRIKTLIIKTIGVITSVLGGLACGKEGPMIHSGAVVAAGISQGKSTTFGKDLNILKYFREDHEKRDFVSGGAAAGVAAAFGAPVGGVLFSLEEGASFWNQSLTWRIFFASIISTFTLNVILSAYHGRPGQLSYSGLLNFGKFSDLRYDLFEIVIFIGFGVIGGLTGALYNFLNHKLTVFRMRYMSKRYVKVLEAILIATVSACVPILMIYTINDCRALGVDPTDVPVQMHCGDAEYNTLAALWLQVPEKSVRSLFHNPVGAFDILSLSVFVIAYFLLSVWTYGMSVSGGLFIPALVTGAAWGRLLSLLLAQVFPAATWIDPGKYALIGAAAQLGGEVRMTISLTVILIEATGNISFALPLMATLITAKWIGDFFTEGLYDIHIQLSGIPLLAWDPPPLTSNITAKVIKSDPVICFQTTESVGRIIDVLRTTNHNGFPIVDTPRENETSTNGPSSSNTNINDNPEHGRLVGLINRSQLIILIKNKIYKENHNWIEDSIRPDIFQDEYPRYPDISELNITEDDRDYTIKLSSFMNTSPFNVQEVTSLPRVFKLFRALGLRHVIVVNKYNNVVGIITRKDLAKFRVWKHGGRMGVEQLKFSDFL